MGSHRRMIRHNLRAIQKDLRKFQRRVGATVDYYEFDPVHTRSHDTYDEGAIPNPFWPAFHQRGPGVVGRSVKRLPAIWVFYTAPDNVYSGEGHYTPSSVAVRFSRSVMVGSGIRYPEDPARHFNDRFFYNGKLYRIDSYTPKGWVGGVYNMIDISGPEVMADELVSDRTPPFRPYGTSAPWQPGEVLNWPPALPHDVGDREG